MSIALLDDAVGSGQPQTSPFTFFLGGEKRLKKTRPHFGWHAHAIITDGDHDEISGRDVTAVPRIFFTKSYVTSFNRELAAIRHGIAGVKSKVENYLLDLARIRFYNPQIAKRESDETDIFTKQAPQHAVHTRNNGVQIKQGRLQNLLAAEGQQLTSEPSGAIGRL